MSSINKKNSLEWSDTTIYNDRQISANLSICDDVSAVNNKFNEFINLSCSEIIEYDVNEFDDEIVGYLFKNYRYDFKDICVYLVVEENEIWVENMAS